MAPRAEERQGTHRASGSPAAIAGREGAEIVLQAMRAAPYGAEAVVIGEVKEAPQGRVLVRTAIGTTRVVDMLAGEMLPRIC